MIAAAPPLPAPQPADVLPVELRAPEAMPEADRVLAKSAHNAIAAHAALASIDFSGGSWTQTQIVCPALPGHLFLRYTRSLGAGSVSEFSVAVLRGGKTRVHVLPILRRGYTPFTPVESIAAFNRIRQEEPAAQSPAWVGLARCYAALTGASPAGAAILAPDRDQTTVRILDNADSLPPRDWILTFDSRGNLVKARIENDEELRARIVPAGPEPVARTVPRQ